MGGAGGARIWLGAGNRDRNRRFAKIPPRISRTGTPRVGRKGNPSYDGKRKSFPSNAPSSREPTGSLYKGPNV